MKFKFLLLCLICFVTVSTIKANNKDLFKYDQKSLDQEFSTINQLEETIVSAEINSPESIQEKDAILYAELLADGYNSSSPSEMNFNASMIDWASFGWGLCCFPLGFIMVAIDPSKTYEQKISYWLGCGTFAIIVAFSRISLGFNVGYY